MRISCTSTTGKIESLLGGYQRQLQLNCGVSTSRDVGAHVGPQIHQLGQFQRSQEHVELATRSLGLFQVQTRQAIRLAQGAGMEAQALEQQPLSRQQRGGAANPEKHQDLGAPGTPQLQADGAQGILRILRRRNELGKRRTFAINRSASPIQAKGEGSQSALVAPRRGKHHPMRGPRLPGCKAGRWPEAQRRDAHRRLGGGSQLLARTCKGPNSFQDAKFQHVLQQRAQQHFVAEDCRHRNHGFRAGPDAQR
mmetsp:Transcript_81432/g.226828  ORF Transcript_81432/g.226828 Transcript_81432/m.226828 type:complete len:252 (-) Transcript_81432:19-774(-)